MSVKPFYTKEEIADALKRKRKALRLRDSYTKENIDDRYHGRRGGKYIGDLVYGANDGIITTFAVVAGAAGASLSPLVIIILGFANLLADGVSMAASSFLSEKSQKDYAGGQRAKEEWEVEHYPEIEVTEVRSYFERFGFTGKDLDRAVEVVISDKEKWVDLMMVFEHSVVEEEKDEAWKHATATFVAFVGAGLAPLLPFIVPAIAANAGLYSPIFASIALFTVGSLRTLVSPKVWWKGGLEMLVVGSLAGGLSYSIGYYLEKFLSSFF